METEQLSVNQNSIPLRKIVIICCSYFVTLILLVFVTLIFDIPLSVGESFFVGPSRWNIFLIFVYYGVPFIIAFIAGVFYRPFWRNFFVLIISIFAIHLLYSTAVSVPRFLYARAWQGEIAQSKAGKLEISSPKEQLSDENNDGLTDKLTLKGNLNVSSLTDGNYLLLYNFSQNGQLLPLGGGSIDMPVNGGKADPFILPIDPIEFKDYAGKGEIDINLELVKKLVVSSRVRSILFFCGWDAFFCPSSRDTSDPVIHDDIVPIQKIGKVHSFSLSAETIQRDQVIVTKFLNDFGRDTNGNGIFDELVVQMEFDSIYAGPIYFYAQVERASNFFLQTTLIKKGVTAVDFVMDGTELKKLGFSGPYELNNFYFLNNEPCGTCIIQNQPPFTVYLEDYLTQPYNVQQFE